MNYTKEQLKDLILLAKCGCGQRLCSTCIWTQHLLDQTMRTTVNYELALFKKCPFNNRDTSKSKSDCDTIWKDHAIGVAKEKILQIIEGKNEIHK